MIQGRVNQAREPIVDIGLVGTARVKTVPAIVDTGFTGDLCVAEQQAGHLDMAFVDVGRYRLANGEAIDEEIFRATILLDERQHEVDLILTDSPDTLIGASLLRDYELSIDYPRRTVRIERATDSQTRS